MREIEFRARWLYDNGEITQNGTWEYGSLIRFPDADYCKILPEGVPDPDDGVWVDPKTVGQFTGLKDKNGEKIWEKDIFELGEERYIVNYRSGCFMADNIRNGHSLTHAKEDVRVWHTLMESSLLIEILGNVYENPELRDKR